MFLKSWHGHIGQPWYNRCCFPNNKMLIIWSDCSGAQNFRQNYSTPPGGMGVGWNSKWVGWIPPVAIPNPDQPTLAIFLTHHYFCTEKEWIQIMILSIFGILGEKVKLSSRTCLLHLVPQINLVFSHFGDCSRALDSWEKLYPPPQEKRLQNCPIDLKAHAHL